MLADVAAAIGAQLDVRQDAPGFKRVVLSRGDEGLVIDLVKDVNAQLHPDKLEHDHIVVDPADEILANKLTAIVGRAEERDRMLLAQSPVVVRRARPSAQQPLACERSPRVAAVGGQDPRWDRAAAGVPPAELRTYLAELICRLLVLAAPDEPGSP